MNNNDIILKEELFESNEFKKWHESYVSVINHALMPIKEFIRNWEDKYGKLPKSEPIKENDLWFIKTKDEIINLKTDLIIKSIELGLYFKELEEKKDI